jgi:hypothetical protein
MKKGKTEAIKYGNQTKKEGEGNVKGSAVLVQNLLPLPKDAGMLEV